MNNNKEKKEYLTDEEVTALLSAMGSHVKPSEASLHSLLNSIPKLVPRSHISTYWSFLTFPTILIAVCVVMIFVSTGIFYGYRNSSQPGQNIYTDSANNSDITIANRIQAIDSQMNGLDSDSTNIAI